MIKSFSKFRRRALILRILKSALITLFVGFSVLGALLFLTSFGVLELKQISSVLISALSGATAFTLSYLLLRTSDKRIAMILDKEYMLNEKTQTMLAFSGESGAIYELQRQDAEKALAVIKDKAVSLKRLWIYILSFVLGAGIFVSSLLIVPKDDVPEPIVDVPFAITEMQILATEELIAYVESSSMISPERENLSSELRSLLAKLKTVTSENDKDTALYGSFEKILGYVDSSSSALELIEEIWKSDNEEMRALAKALNYYDWPKSDEQNKFLEKLNAFASTLAHPDADLPDAELDKLTSDTCATLIGASTDIATSLTRSGISVSDPLTAVLVKLGNANESDGGTRLLGLSALAERKDELGGYAQIQRELNSTLEALSGEIFSALCYHKDSTSVGEYAITRLSSIFGCSPPKFDRPTLVLTEGSGTSDENEEGGEGGAIGSGTQYGSDDLVYDPLTDSYVEYGTILERYYALAFGKLENEVYTEEERLAIEKYFDLLYGGFDDEE